MKRSLVLLMLLCSALPTFGSVSVRPSRKNTLDVAISGEPLSVAVAALQPYLSRPVDLLVGNDPVVTCRASKVSPEAALRALATAAGLQLVEEHGRFWLRDAREPSVTLDVKDEDVRAILGSLQKQCSIKNLMVDPHVQGKGTFLFHDVPCRTAFDTVLRSLGLSSTTYGTSVVAVNGRSR